MEYQKIANLIDDTSNQPSKFKTKIWVEINDGSRGTYNANSLITFKTTILKCSLCDYSDTYILVKGTIDVNNTAAADADASNTNKKVIFKNCAPITNCISEINNTQVDNAKGIAIVVPVYNLIEYTNNYSKISGSLWQYCKDIPVIAMQTGDNGTKNVEIMVPLKYLSNFWRTLEIPLIKCGIDLILTWSTNCVIVSTNVANQNATFEITNTKLYVPVVTSSTAVTVVTLSQ